MTPAFDKLYQEILLEMPLLKGDYVPDNYEFDQGSMDDKIEDVLDNKIVAKFNNFDVYLDDSGDFDRYYFMDGNEYVANVFISKTGRKNSTDGLWKNKKRPDISMLDIILNFILLRYDYIQSSSYHTNQAKKFWIKALNFALSNGYKCGIFDYSDQSENILQSVDDFSEVIDHVWSNEDTHPRIYQK